MDALGLDEFMWWCNNMNMMVMLAIWAGKSYGSIVSGDQLEPYVDNIMNELEYLLGSTNNTTWGAKHMQNSCVELYVLKYVNIGNEDYLTGGCPTYPEWFMQIYDAIHLIYLDLTLIMSTVEEDCLRPVRCTCKHIIAQYGQFYFSQGTPEYSEPASHGRVTFPPVTISMSLITSPAGRSRKN